MHELRHVGPGLSWIEGRALYLPLAGSLRWRRRQPVRAPLLAVTRALFCASAWEAACPWLEVHVFQARVEDDGVHLRIDGRVRTRLLPLEVRLALRARADGDALRLDGEGELRRITPFRIAARAASAADGCVVDLSATVDAVPAPLRPVLGAVEHRVAAAAAAALEAFARRELAAGPTG